MSNEERIKKLENQVAELLAWKEARMRQQLTYPLDKISKDVLSKDFFVWTGRIASVPPFPDGAICLLNGAPIAVHVQSASDYE